MDSVKILISIIGNSIATILNLTFFLLIRIYFPIDVIGYYGVIFSFLRFFGFILGLGIVIVYLKLISEAKDSEQEALCNGTFLLLRFIQFILYSVLLLISIFVFQVDVKLFIIFFLGILVEFANSTIFEPVLISKKQIFRKSLTITTLSLIKIILLITITNLFTSNIWLLACIYLISNLLIFVLNLYFLKNIKFKKPTLEYGKKFLKLSYPLFIRSSLIFIVGNIYVLIVNIWSSIEDVANFYTATQIFDTFLFLLGNISLILTLSFSKNISLGNNKKNLEIIKRIVRFLNLFITPTVSFIILYSTQMIVLIFGESYKLTGIILSILSLNLIVFSIDLSYKIQLRALGKFGLLTKIVVFESVLSISLIILFIAPFFLNMGAIGGAIALVMSKIITHIFFRLIIYKKFNLGYYWGLFRNIGIMFGINMLQLYINLLFSYQIFIMPIFIILNLFLYFLVNYIFKGFSKEDMELIRTIFNLKNIKKSIISELKTKT